MTSCHILGWAMYSFSSTLLCRGQFTLKTSEVMSSYSEALQDVYCTVVVAVLALQCGQAHNFAAPKCPYLLQRYFVHIVEWSQGTGFLSDEPKQVLGIYLMLSSYSHSV